jgi:hypothetical protein
VFVGDDDDSGIGGDISFLFRVVFFPSSSISTAESAAAALGVVSLPLLLPRLRFGEGEGIIYITYYSYLFVSCGVLRMDDVSHIFISFVSFFFFFLLLLLFDFSFCFLLLLLLLQQRERERKKSCQSQRISFSEKRKKIGKIVPQTHNILFKPTETLAKNTKKTKTPNARKKMLRPPVESRF